MASWLRQHIRHAVGRPGSAAKQLLLEKAHLGALGFERGLGPGEVVERHVKRRVTTRVEAHGQQMAVHDVVAATVGRDQCLDLTPDPLQSLPIVLTCPRQARGAPEQARCEPRGEEIRPP